MIAPNDIAFSKYADGLVPCVVQDDLTRKVLMVGFMNRDALERTIDTGKVCFYSRSRNQLWTKGETSGNHLQLVDIKADCDFDTLLVKAKPDGPTCHTGAATCFFEENETSLLTFLPHLESIIANRKNNPSQKSYTSTLFEKGINKIAQKVGEEAVELVIESKDDNADLFLNEAADLLFHYLILLQAKNYSLQDVVRLLAERHRQ